MHRTFVFERLRRFTARLIPFHVTAASFLVHFASNVARNLSLNCLGKKSMKLIISALGMVTALTLSSVGSAQTVEKKALTLEGAKKVIAAAIAEAKSKNAPGGAIAVVDEGGNLIALERLDNTFAAGANISIARRGLQSCSKGPRSSSKM